MTYYELFDAKKLYIEINENESVTELQEAIPYNFCDGSKIDSWFTKDILSRHKTIWIKKDHGPNETDCLVYCWMNKPVNYVSVTEFLNSIKPIEIDESEFKKLWSE